MHIRECFKLGSILNKLLRARKIFIYIFIKCEKATIKG